MAIPGGRESYWEDLARSYAALGPPLCPSSEDLGLLEEAVTTWTAMHAERRLQALLLGVTPTIVQMRWPEASSLMAVDASLPMVRAVWPGNVPHRRWGVCGNWQALPRRESSCDLVIGDGSMNCVPYPDGLRSMAETVRSVLREDGLLVLRCYVQPAAQERPEQVLADVFRGAVPSFHHFKFRLLMAMQQSPRQGIAVDEVYRYWASLHLDPEVLASRTGWPRPAIDTIELYRGKDTVHAFPTLAEFRQVLHEFFAETSLSIPSYNLGERCPVLVLRPRCRTCRSSNA